MKIVINNCFGGFGMSHAGVMAYAERKGITLFAFVNARKRDGGIDFAKMVPYQPGDSDDFCIHYSKSQLEDDDIPNEQYFSDRDIPRDDPALVGVVTALGERANGRCARLKVVEIPDDVEWEIDEYDGNESIHEKHRAWC